MDYRLELPQSIKFQKKVEQMMGKKLPVLCLTEEDVSRRTCAHLLKKEREVVMLEKMIFGRYIPGDSFIHRLDARAKLIFVFLFIAVVFIANNWITYGILVAIYIFNHSNVQELDFTF